MRLALCLGPLTYEPEVSPQIFCLDQKSVSTLINQRFRNVVFRKPVRIEGAGLVIVRSKSSQGIDEDGKAFGKSDFPHFEIN